ncbi:hypothetical protein, partial [uncultured Duncaniella sp.]
SGQSGRGPIFFHKSPASSSSTPLFRGLSMHDEKKDTKEHNRQKQQKYNLLKIGSIQKSGSCTMKRDTKEHNRQKQQKYNLLKLTFLYLLTLCRSVPFSDVD